MSAALPTVEQLVQELCDLEDMQIGTRSNDSLFKSTYAGKHGPPHFFWLGTSAWLGLDGEQWRLFTRLDSIQRVRFVRAPEGGCTRRPEDRIPGEESLTVHLMGRSNEATLTFAFGHLYDEQKRPVPARFALWEALRAKYGGCDELRLQDGGLTCLKVDLSAPPPLILGQGNRGTTLQPPGRTY